MSDESSDDFMPPNALNFESADAALHAIQYHEFLREFDWKPEPFDWPKAAAAIASDPAGLVLDADRFWLLEKVLRNASDDGAADPIREASHGWAEANWNLVVDRIRNEALRLCTGALRLSSFEKDFATYIEHWPRLSQDRGLLDSALLAFERDGRAPDSGIKLLRMLRGDQGAAARVLAAMERDRSAVKGHGDFSSLVAEWAGDSVWGQLHHLLWCADANNVLASPRLIDVPEPVTQAALLLLEFGLSNVAGPRYRLDALSPETRASWRRELARAVGDFAELRAAVTEALMWFGVGHDDRAVLFAVLELHRHGKIGEVRQFLSHVSGLVRRRAAAVLDLAGAAPDAIELRSKPTSPQLVAEHAPDALGPARTWIGDARIERLLEDALNEAAQEFGKVVRGSRGSGEEALISTLFALLGAAFKQISDRLKKHAAESDANERLDIKLEYRLVGKHEEGGKGVGSDRFSTDIALVFEAWEAGHRFAKRASLLQGKRIFVRQSALDIEYYPVDASQLRDIAEQTMASFLLLVGPNCEGVAMPVIPARLLLDMVERGDSAHQIAPARAVRLGKSLAAWLVNDVIGLWTGDWDESLVNKAKGEEGCEPFVLVEIKATRVPKGPEGW